MKNLMVTGASSEIGCWVMENFGFSYDKIIAQYRTMNKSLENIKEKYGEKICFIKSDFSSEDSINFMLEEIKSKNFIPNDIIHLPAPKYAIKNFEKFDWADYQNNINISLKSAVIILKNLLPKMAKNGGGKVIFMLSSCVENTPPKYITTYCVTKYALLGLMKQLSEEFYDKKICFFGISPDMIETKFLSEIPRLIIEKNAAENKLKKNLNVDDLRQAFDEILLGDKIKTGQNILVTAKKGYLIHDKKSRVRRY